MENLLRALVFDNQVSLTLANTTKIVEEGRRLHELSNSATKTFGKALSAMVFMSACLKEKSGEISLSLQGGGTGGNMGISGNQALLIRGYIENPACEGEEKEVLGDLGALTIIRDDGYNRPFVGSCAYQGETGIDGAFEAYFSKSEQLPTYIKTAVQTKENGEVVFSGVVALQPLPFASEETLEKVKNAPLEEVLKSLKTQSIAQTATKYFSSLREAEQMRFAQYKCNCSRDYLSRVIVTLGKTQAENIVKEDGAIKVHCHYCNSNYTFTQNDLNELFE